MEDGLHRDLFLPLCVMNFQGVDGHLSHHLQFRCWHIQGPIRAHCELIINCIFVPLNVNQAPVSLPDQFVELRHVGSCGQLHCDGLGAGRHVAVALLRTWSE